MKFSDFADITVIKFAVVLDVLCIDNYTKIKVQIVRRKRGGEL